MMFAEIFRFELRYHLRSPVFWLGALAFFLLTFGAITTDAIVIGGSIGNVHRNSPYVVMQILLIMSILGVFVTTAFVAGAVVRDFDHRTHEILFSTPVRKRDYLLGRFTGALTTAVLFFLPVMAAIMIGSLMPWLDPERIGPFRLDAYTMAMIVSVIPNMVLMSVVFFALATTTRSMLYTYVGVVAFFVAYAIAGTLLADIENQQLAALLDPFGGAALELTTRYWTTAERNAMVVGFEGLVLQNRLLWLGVAGLLFAGSYARFRLTALETRRARKRRASIERADLARPSAAGVAARTARAPAQAVRVVPGTGRAAAVRQFVGHARIEARRVLGSLPFFIILSFGLLNLVGLSINLDQLVGTSVYPVTHLMLNAIEGSFLLFAFILLVLYAGELYWHDRNVELGDVIDALPVPTWVIWGSKLVALSLVILAVLAASMLAAIVIQLLRGFTDIDLPLYLTGLFVMRGVPLLQVGVLALFFQAALHSKYGGWLVMILYFVSLPVMNALDFTHNLYQYAQSPPAPYSEMNGYGPFVAPTAWFYLYWSLAAVVLIVLTHLLWIRGRETGWRMRLKEARRRFRRPVVWTLGIAMLAFVVCGGFIYYNTNVLNEYVPGDEALDRRAEYERAYKRYENIAQPRISRVYTEVDIHPDRRDVVIRGRYGLVNRTDRPIDSLHVTLNPDLELRTLHIPGATLAMEDTLHGYRIFTLATPLAAGDSLDMSFGIAAITRGFPNSGANTNIVGNGTFINSFAYLPHLGYSGALEMQDPNERRKRDLPPVQRMHPLEDEAARINNYISSEADWVDFETIVSTSTDQIALAPGYLEDERTGNGRRYFHYRMDAPILNFFSWLSADWAVTRDRWNDVAIEVYHHPDHTYNVDRMIEAVKASLDYFTTNFSPYQHRQVRILEFPRYATFAQSFPNTIPFSESIGFIARMTDPADIDYVFYVTAHEVAHQWWAHQVIGADVQGATVMSETLSQYSALMVMEKEYGPDYMRRFLKYELDRYLAGRGSELLEELPLLRVENQPYIHYRKGSVVMYALKDYIGEEALNAALHRYVEKVAFQQPPYTTSLELLDAIRAVTPEDRATVIEDLFETITLWENETKTASYAQREDGKYVVTLEIESHKYRASGEGEETEVPMDGRVDVGVFGERSEDGPDQGAVLFLEKLRVTGPTQTFEIVVDALPLRAGIDPYNKLIDRNPDNNVRPVTGSR